MSDKKTLFIGCGTGRCGTESISRLINNCHNAVCTHEKKPLLPWIFDEELFLKRVKYFSEASSRLVGDVASFYLPYVEYFIHSLPSTKIICLERDRHKVVNSFIVKSLGYNHWKIHDGTHWIKHPYWDEIFPKYDIENKANAIGAYWDEYHRKINDIAEKYPKHVKIFAVDVLNTEEGQKKIFDFLEIPRKSRFYQAECRFNVQKFDKDIVDPSYERQFLKKLFRAFKDLQSIILPSDRFIAVDEGFRDFLYFSSGRLATPFLERDNVYWGMPPDDETAISELERLRFSGASYIVFGWWAYWWLDYYKEFNNYLRLNSKCLLENDHLLIFDLRN